MLYFLVGSRDLDGGLMCTASHNPKAYTGAKLVKAGAIALSGDAGIQDIRRTIEAGLGDPPAGRRARSRRSTSPTASTPRRLEFIDPAAVRPLKVVLDGGNGMAGPMVGPDPRRGSRASSWSRPTGSPTATSPTTSPTRCWRRTAASSSTRCSTRAPTSGIAWDGDADRCFFIDDTGRFVDGDFMTALLAESMLEKQPGAEILYDVRASRAVADTVERLGGTAR